MCARGIIYSYFLYIKRDYILLTMWKNSVCVAYLS